MTNPTITRISSTRHRFPSSSHQKYLILPFFLLYLYFLHRIPRKHLTPSFDTATGCNIFDGSWLPSDPHPIYNSSLCPFIEQGFNCLGNGRRDTDYLRWRWKPRRCELKQFDAAGVLGRLRGRRIVFVGDSMSRTQWESLICMLMSGVEDAGSVHEVNGNGISKTIEFLGVEFRSFNFSVEFFRSVFLVRQGVAPRVGPRRVRMVLRLDRMDGASRRWVDSDILVFNSGHWWTPAKLFDV